MKEMHGLIFAYRSSSSMRELSAYRAVGSVPYGGRYRVIDFILSNMVNAGVTDIGVIMRDNYQSLLDHLGSGKDWDLSRKRGGLRLLPPFGMTRGVPVVGSYRGKMDALASIRTYIHKIKEKYVVLAEEDLIANFDLEKIMEYHIAVGADITAVCTEHYSGVPRENTYFMLGEDNHVDEVIIGPEKPKGLLSAGLYVLETELLERLIDHCATHKLYNFDEDVLQRMSDSLRIFGYVLPGLAVRLQSTAAYFQESMRLLQKDFRSELFQRGRPIKTKVRDDAPTYYAPGSRAANSIIADGCYIDGDVENSVLFRGVRIEKGAKVSNSILMQDTVVSSGAILNNAIADKEVLVKPGRMLMGHETYPIVIAKGSIV